jgi:hypothetical protein
MEYHDNFCKELGNTGVIPLNYQLPIRCVLFFLWVKVPPRKKIYFGGYCFEKTFQHWTIASINSGT